MKTVQISLNSIGKVKSFVNTISQFEYDFDLISGRYVIDAKSIMGIFSLNLDLPLELIADTDDEKLVDEKCKDKDILALIRYLAEEDRAEKILENQQVIRTPVVRNGKLATVGYQPDIWKNWN